MEPSSPKQEAASTEQPTCLPVSEPPTHPLAESLAPIHEEPSNVSVEEEKLSKLFRNYEKLKENFDSLMNELKSNSEGQQKIITELVTLKNDYKEGEELRLQQLQLEKKKREDVVEDRQVQILELRKELQAMKADEKTTLEKQICDRIDKLEEIVRKNFEELNEDRKEAMVWVNPERSRAVSKEGSRLEEQQLQQMNDSLQR